MNIELLGFVKCQYHEIWHEVHKLSDEENETWQVACGNCWYDYDDFCKTHDTFMILGEPIPSPNDPWLQELQDIEWTHD